MHALIFFVSWWQRIFISSLVTFQFPVKSYYMWKDSCPLVFNHSNYIYRGVPPNIVDLQTEPDKVKLFADSMLVQNIAFMYSTKLKRVLLLLFWYVMNHFLVILVMKNMVSTKIQPIIPSTRLPFMLFHKKTFQLRLFADGRLKSLNV